MSICLHRNVLWDWFPNIAFKRRKENENVISKGFHFIHAIKFVVERMTFIDKIIKGNICLNLNVVVEKMKIQTLF